MSYPEDVVLKELMWEYDYTEEQARSILTRYKQNGEYSKLCQFIERRLHKEDLKYV